MSGLAALVPSVSRPANRICKLPYSNCTSSHKKNRSSELGGFFLFRICLLQNLFDRGDGGTRTLVQTSNLDIFYMLSFYLIFVRKPTKNNLLPA